MSALRSPDADRRLHHRTRHSARDPRPPRRADPPTDHCSGSRPAAMEHARGRTGAFRPLRPTRASVRIRSTHCLVTHHPRPLVRGGLRPGVPRPATLGPPGASTANRRHFSTASNARFVIDQRPWPAIAPDTLRTGIEIPSMRALVKPPFNYELCCPSVLLGGVSFRQCMHRDARGWGY